MKFIDYVYFLQDDSGTKDRTHKKKKKHKEHRDRGDTGKDTEVKDKDVKVKDKKKRHSKVKEDELNELEQFLGPPLETSTGKSQDYDSYESLWLHWPTIPKNLLSLAYNSQKSVVTGL